MELIELLHRQIDDRVKAIEAPASPPWPCRAGCDGCCRKLADLPRLTPAEWQLMEQGLSALPAGTLEQIGARLQEEVGRRGTTGPYTCPMLDRDTGRCLVYPHRPVACRTYGYYVERDKGLYCGIILDEVERGARDGVVWGNQASVDATLAAIGGAAESLAAWWARRG